MYFTDDPVKDFYRYDAKCAAEEKKLPTCEICGEPIVTDKCYVIFDSTICPDCVEDCKHDTENFIKE